MRTGGGRALGFRLLSIRNPAGAGPARVVPAVPGARPERTGPAGREAARLPPAAAAGLLLFVVGSSVLFDPWGYSGYLAIKVLPAGIGLLLMLVSLGRDRALMVPAGPWAVVGPALVGLMVASSLSSRAVWRSLLGAPIRLEGMLAWLGFATAFVAGLSLWRRYRNGTERSIVSAAVAAVLAVAAVGVLEAVGVEIDSDTIPFMGRIRSTLGNPATLTGFLVLAGPVAALAIGREGRRRWPGWACCYLVLFNLAAAQTRSVIAAVGVWCVVIGLVRLRGRARWMIAAGVLAAVVGFSFLGRWEQVGDDLARRAAVWRVAVSVIADDPLLGSGPEMFIAGYGGMVDDETVRRFGRRPVVDRAHNGVLDFTASFGVPAGALYVAVLAAVGLLALGAVRRGDWFRVAVGSGVAIYLLHQQVFFVHPTLDMLWWLMVGMLVAGGDGPLRPAPRGAYILMLGIAALLVLNAASLLQNDRRYIRAAGPAPASDAYQHLDAAAARRPFDDLTYLLMGGLLSDAPDPSLVVRGVEAIESGARHNPGNELVAFALSDVRLQAHRLTADPSFATDAARDLSTLVADQPANGDAYLKRGVALYYLGDIKAARSDWERAAFLMPDRPEPLQNLEVTGPAGTGQG